MQLNQKTFIKLSRYFQVENLNNQIAEFFHKENYVKGDAIALMMENRPEYVCFWLGLSKLGVITALINTNLRKDVLVHSIKIGRCKGVVVSEDCLDGELIFIGE